MKKIFIEAHKMTREIVKKYEVNYQVQFGLCLSYLLEKEEEEILEIEIKSWFVLKNFSSEERYAESVSDKEIVRETEKAVLIKFVSDFGTFTKWIPKSCLMTEEDFRIEREREEKRIARFEERQRKYKELVKFAKENKVKGVRIGFRKETIINKIKEAGLEVPAGLVA